jgi:hypothetical protein
MHERMNIRLSAADRGELEAVVANRDSPQKHAWRATIVITTAGGRGTAAIMRATGKVIWRWAGTAVAAIACCNGRQAGCSVPCVKSTDAGFGIHARADTPTRVRRSSAKSP